jgi:hypothetical protein
MLGGGGGGWRTDKKKLNGKTVFFYNWLVQMLSFLDDSVADPCHFGGGSGSGSSDPCLWLMDPDPDPGSGSFYFRHWPSRCQQKHLFLNTNFSAYYFLKLNLLHFSNLKSQEEYQQSRNQGFSYYFCMMIEGSRSGSCSGSGYLWLVDLDPDPGATKTCGSGGSRSATLLATNRNIDIVLLTLPFVLYIIHW